MSGRIPVVFKIYIFIYIYVVWQLRVDSGDEADEEESNYIPGGSLGSGNPLIGCRRYYNIFVCGKHMCAILQFGKHRVAT